MRRSTVLLSLLALLLLSVAPANRVVGAEFDVNRFEDIPLEDVLGKGSPTPVLATKNVGLERQATIDVEAILQQADQLEMRRPSTVPASTVPASTSPASTLPAHGSDGFAVDRHFQVEGRATDPLANGHLEGANSSPSTSAGTTTVHTSVLRSPKFDVSQPIEVEVESAANASMVGNDPTFSESMSGEFIDQGPLVVHDSTALMSGYDGMVDAYVHQLLTSGCATPGTLPGVASVATDSTLQLCQQLDGGIGASGWYAQAQALFLQPFGDQRVVTTVDDLTGRTELATDQLFNDFETGFDGRIGFRTGYSALEIGWWSLFANTSEATAISPPGNLFSVINFIELDINFNGAQLHQIRSEMEVHTFELNQRHLLSNWNTGRLRFAYMWGLRFTRISDQLRFTADLDNTTLGDAAGEVFYETEVDNRLIGPQIGGSVLWQFRPKTSLLLDAKAGVFFNYIDQDQSAGTATGPATIVAGPDTGSQFVIDQDEQQASLMTEIQFNVEHSLTDRLKLVFGYRVFAASGIAQSRSQIPWRFGELGATVVDSSDALLLHGLQIGMDANF